MGLRHVTQLIPLKAALMLRSLSISNCDQPLADRPILTLLRARDINWIRSWCQCTRASAFGQIFACWKSVPSTPQPEYASGSRDSTLKIDTLCGRPYGGGEWYGKEPSGYLAELHQRQPPTHSPTRARARRHDSRPNTGLD